MKFCKLSSGLHEKVPKTCALILTRKVIGFLEMFRFRIFFQFPVGSSTKDNFFYSKTMCFIVRSSKESPNLPVSLFLMGSHSVGCQNIEALFLSPFLIEVVLQPSLITDWWWIWKLPQKRTLSTSCPYTTVHGISFEALSCLIWQVPAYFSAALPSLAGKLSSSLISSVS